MNPEKFSAERRAAEERFGLLEPIQSPKKQSTPDVCQQSEPSYRNWVMLESATGNCKINRESAKALVDGRLARPIGRGNKISRVRLLVHIATIPEATFVSARDSKGKEIKYSSESGGSYIRSRRIGGIVTHQHKISRILGNSDEGSLTIEEGRAMACMFGAALLSVCHVNETFAAKAGNEDFRAGSGVERCDPYKRYIRGLACTICGRDPSSEFRVEAAHTKVLGSGGTGIKASDFSCIPLCARCHTQRPRNYHSYGQESEWEAFWRVDLKLLVKNLNREWESRCLKSKPVQQLEYRRPISPTGLASSAQTHLKSLILRSSGKAVSAAEPLTQP